MNGWSNHATWNVALWLGNTESVYAYIVGRAKAGKLTDAAALNEYAALAFTRCGFVDRISYRNRVPCTPDGVRLNDPLVNWGEIFSAQWTDT